MARERRNARYLPDAVFGESLSVTSDIDDALSGARDVLVVVPSHSFRALLREIAPRLKPDMGVAWATKGFELDSGKLPHQVAREVLGPDRAVAVLSGPTFAREVGQGLPTAMTIASSDATFASALAQELSSPNFRAYTSTDIIGVEVGGAVKNVLAVGAGASDGLGFGANTRIALITRGLAEMMRLGVELGAQRETFMGLAGLGDLVLTCTDDQSRNRRFGLLLAAGRSVEQALAEIGQVVEGYLAAKAVRAVALREKVEMPICEGVYKALYEGMPAIDVVKGLMSRPIKAEAEPPSNGNGSRT
jgi:glycerol-3-phosphate dehydrogenase (NAD(P)+)